eukprot:334537-Pelagomonas_calceolata.AAC.1
MVIEHHNIASRTVLRVISEGSYVSNLIHIDVGNADRLAQHGPHITERAISPCLFASILLSTRVQPPRQEKESPGVQEHGGQPSRSSLTLCTSSRPDAILVTPCPANLNRPLVTKVVAPSPPHIGYSAA